MTLLNDRQIIFEDKLMRESGGAGMINPFAPEQVRENNNQKIISYGLSSFGYDIRLDESIYVPKVQWGNLSVIDPKTNSAENRISDLWDFEKINKNGYEIAPHGFVLANSLEQFHIPDDVLAVCVGKSTYARCGLVVNVTPLEPGWRGYLTLEISNTTSSFVKIYPSEGIAQLLFYKGERPSITYADRSGKYQDQIKKPIMPRI
jgi:dCTP deaminase